MIYRVLWKPEKAVCGCYAGRQYSQIFPEDGAAEYAYAPEYIEDNGRGFFGVNVY